MNVLVIDPAVSGHHANYLRWITLGVVKRGHRPILATSEKSLDHPVIRNLKESLSSLGWVSIEGGQASGSSALALVQREFGYWQLFRAGYRQAAKNYEIDHIILPYLDWCAYAMGLLGVPFGGTKWSGIVMRPSFHYRAMGIRAHRKSIEFIKERLFLQLLKRSDGGTVFSIDEALVEYVQTRYPVLKQKLRYLSHPIDSHRKATHDPVIRATYGIPEKALLVLVYGAISPRKGLDILLRALASSKALTVLHLLVAGCQDEEARRLLKGKDGERLRSEGRLHEWDRYIGEAEEIAAFGMANLTWLGYRDHFGMSGVLVVSAFHGVPVIAGNEGSIGWLTRKHGLGVALPDLTVASLVAAFSSFCKIDAKQLRQIQERCAAFSEGYTFERGQDMLLDTPEQASARTSK